MKKSIQKLAFMLLISFYGLSVQSQVFQCSNINQSSSPPSGNPCPAQFINDFIPKSSDSVLRINLKFHFIRPTSGTTAWDNLRISYIDSAIHSINVSLASNPIPSNPYPNVTHVSDTKLSLVRISQIDTLVDDSVYKHGVDNYIFPTNPTITPMTHLINQNAINLYFGGRYTQYHTGADLFYNGIIWYLRHTIDTFLISNLPYFTKTLRHEISHALGLEHIKNYDFAVVNSNCCNYIEATDYYLEPFPNPSITNNIMANNGYSEYAYYSPQQLGLIHYKLRTSNKHFLTQNSYNTGISRNSASDYVVQNSQTWTSDRYFKGNITIDSGKVLKIWCNVGMTKGSYIIVKKGAQLVVELNGNVTNFSGQLWGGINVQGTSNLGQMVNNTTFFANNHGVARVINGGKVSQAENGLKNYITDSNGNINWSSRGGVIMGDGGVFENNIRDVEFLSYQSPLGNDRSMFKSCTFRTDSNFNSTSPPYAHVSMWNTKGIQFKGCTFEHLAGDKFGFDHGRGIHSIDAIYSVDKNGATTSKFNNLSWGVLVGNTNPLKVVNIQNSEFTDCEVDAVYLKNMNNALFNNNIVNIPYYYASTGLYLHTCKNYQVKNNTFEETPAQQFKYNVGVYAYNSQAGSHQIYNNLFSNLEQGISAIANNSGVQNMTDGLKMNCNDFVSGASNKYDIAMLNYFDGETVSVPATVKSEQGNINPTNLNPFLLVRNKYGSASACSVCENKWYIEGAAAKRVYHGSNANLIGDPDKHPTPQPSNSDTAVKDIVHPTIQYDNGHCPVNPGTNGGVNPTSAKLAALNDYLAYLIENNDGYNNLVYDIQATISEKINYFASDTLSESADSLIALVTNHSAYLTDSDLLLIYAYMNKGNYTEAENLTNNLSSNRAIWKTFLLKLIEVYTETDMIYSLGTNTANAAFFNNYAMNDTLDGQAAAQALLGFVLKTEYEEPRLHPAEGGERKAQLEKESFVILNNSLIKMYPNPSHNGVFIEYGEEKNIGLAIELRDLMGRLIFTTFVKGSGTTYLDLKEISNGLYLLSVSNERKEFLYQSKLIKQE